MTSSDAAGAKLARIDLDLDFGHGLSMGVPVLPVG